MKVTYSPEDGDRQEWDFNPGRVRAAEAELIEKRFGEPWESFIVELNRGNIKARRVLLWHLMRREHHTLRFEDTPDFYMDELVVEHSVGELMDLRERAEKAPMSDDDKRELLAMIDSEIEDRKAKGEVAEGKARSKKSTSTTA